VEIVRKNGGFTFEIRGRGQPGLASLGTLLQGQRPHCYCDSCHLKYLRKNKRILINRRVRELGDNRL